MITLRHAHYTYRDFNLAMDFTIAQGACVAILGPSGAGKSTLLNVIAGFEQLADGALMLAGKDMTNAPPAERPVSMVFQDNNTFAHLDAWTNVALGISPSLEIEAADKRTIDAALARVGLTELATRKPGEMSGGERQRIALARALVRNRPVLLLDEPFAALGPGLRVRMLDLVKELHAEKGLTTLMVTHAPEDAKRIADEVIFISEGQARPPVPTPKFFLALHDPQVKAYLGSDDE